MPQILLVAVLSLLHHAGVDPHPLALGCLEQFVQLAADDVLLGGRDLVGTLARLLLVLAAALRFFLSGLARGLLSGDAVLVRAVLLEKSTQIRLGRSRRVEQRLRPREAVVGLAAGDAELFGQVRVRVVRADQLSGVRQHARLREGGVHVGLLVHCAFEARDVAGDGGEGEGRRVVEKLAQLRQAVGDLVHKIGDSVHDTLLSATFRGCWVSM